MYLNNENKEIINNYLNKSLLNKLLYLGRGLNIAVAFKEYINADYRSGHEKYNKLVNLLWNQNTKHIKEVFEGKEYGALRLLLGETYAKIFKDIWDRVTLYTYSSGYYRRSYRTNKSTELYLNKNIDKLKECVYLAVMDFTLDKYFADNKSSYENITSIADIIAIELDNNNLIVLEKIKEIVYNDNNTAIITREIIRGLLMSRNEEAHKVIGELLCAAKLQEGLRQAIVESMDECSKKAFIYILKIILDNNLTRFSSVVRAFGTWTGLVLDVEKPKVINKCFEAAYDCLKDEGYRNECIDSNDNLLIYIGIWSVAFDEVEDINQILYKLINTNEKYKKLVALQFLYDTQFMIFRHEFACNLSKERDLEVIALVIKNLFGDLNSYSLKYNADALKAYYKLNENCYGLKLFNELKNMLDMMPKKEIEFKGSVFPWVDFKLTSAEIMEKMMLSVNYSYDLEIVNTLIDYKEKMSAETRVAFVDTFLKHPENHKQKKAIIEALGDRSSSVRQCAFNIVSELSLNNEDYKLIENHLQYKAGDLRKNAIKILLTQPNNEIVHCVQRLTSSNSENKRLAAIDIVSALKGSKDQKDIYEECLSCIISIGDASQKEKMLTKNIIKDVEHIKSFDNGFGLYDKSRDYEVPLIEAPKNFNIHSMFSMTESEVKDILNKFSKLIHDHRDFEYEVTRWDDTKTTITLGGSDYLQSFTNDNHCLENYPLADKIREFAKKNSLDAIKLIELDFYLQSMRRLRYNSYLSWYSELIEKNFNLKMAKGLLKATEKIPYYNILTEYVSLLVKDIPAVERFNMGKKVCQYLYIIIPPDKHYKEYLNKNKDFYHYSNSNNYISESYEISYWLNLMAENIIDEDNFIKFFTCAYNYYKANKYGNHATLTLNHFGRALEIGLIDDNEAYKELMTRPLSYNNIRTITNLHKYNRGNLGNYTKLIEIGATVTDILTSIEVGRGELNTEVTRLAVEIHKCHGVKTFIAIILGLEKDTYVRGYNFVSGDCTKKQILSHLLKCCYPKNGEDANTLKEALKGKKISDKQLIEAAMYSPQWLDIVSEYINYEGLKSACWYFHAHVNEYFSEEKEAIIARFSPISMQDLKDGAFDQQWFVEAYNTIGEKKFKLVYDSAKYIAGGGLHKRSQLFADATLGKLELEEVKNRVMDKRNKEYLLTYSLIPLKNKEDILHRYEYIHQYIKESKKFGAQRQASEGRSANIALLNLARNAGYSDVNRLTFNMETAKFDSISPYLQPHKVEDIELQLVIDELGQADIRCTKDGKTLKNIPTRFKKHEYVETIKTLKKSLKDQYIRAKQSFEASMENGDEFKANELVNFCANPVLAPIIKTLVFKALDKLGYIKEGFLVDCNNEAYKLSPEDNVIIAHPVHLYEAGCWSNYQKDIFSKQITQPFKQVFRELYLPNADELKEQTQSRRYAGHQVQPKKTMALLKTRGWLASHEEGLQKVYYKENIIATIYAIADWFSPADIEAPTIEFVRFEDRKTYKPVSVDKIPKLIFSEVMRDVDLVVSVAHVGGVDPEASLSTIEIRSVIVDELLKLLKLQNVVLKGNHAYIEGVHGEYTVHLGSGVVHKMGTGSINILPVHSSHRGRIFLPFIDQDPKSAEIISKIILLAEDKKLKDPSILTQISN